MMIRRQWWWFGSNDDDSDAIMIINGKCCLLIPLDFVRGLKIDQLLWGNIFFLCEQFFINLSFFSLSFFSVVLGLFVTKLRCLHIREYRVLVWFGCDDKWVNSMNNFRPKTSHSALWWSFLLLFHFLTLHVYSHMVFYLTLCYHAFVL